jgi:nucleoside-diphosphate-sugar epimerase
LASLLLIGGTGFFGKSILDSFKRGLLYSWNINKIVIMSRDNSNFITNYPELISSGVEFLNADISSIDYLPKADFVIHAAASTDVSKYKKSNQKECINITEGAINYCRLAEKFHKQSRIVFCSSGAVYGYQSENLDFLKEDSPFKDLTKLGEVKKIYAQAKRDSENAFKRLAKKDINVTIARCFSFVGTYLPINQHFAIGNFIANGLNGDDIEVNADRLVFRSYMFADDLVEWIFTLAENSDKSCQVYNVGSDAEVEIGDLAYIISRIFDVNVNFIFKNRKKINRYIPCIDKAKKELGLRTKLDLRESIIRSLSKTK